MEFPFTFRQIEVFLAACEEQSFAKAAERLDISEAGVSNQIRSLEERLGCTLFHRHRGKINELSRAGAKFRAGILTILNDLDALTASLFNSDTMTTEVKVFIGGHLFEDCIRPVISDFCIENPDIFLNIVGSTSHTDMIKNFDKGDIDIAVFSTDKSFQHRCMIDICDVGMSVFGTAAMADKARTDGLDSISYIMPPVSTEYRDDITSKLKSIGVHGIDNAGSYLHHDVGVKLAVAGFGAIATLASIVAKYDAEGALQPIVELAQYKRTILVRNAPANDILDRVLAFIVKHTKLDLAA